MRGRLLAAFVLFAAVVIVLLEIPLDLVVASNLRSSALADLQREGASISVLVASTAGNGGQAEMSAIVRSFARSENGIVVVVTGGHVDASAGSGAAEELSDPRTKEIVKSAASGQVSGEEGSPEADDDYMYVALPVAKKASQDQVLLVAIPEGPVDRRIATEQLALGAVGLGMLIVAAGVGMMLSRSLTRPLRAIEEAVAAVGSGHLGARAPADTGPAEIRALGNTVNEMAERLEELVHTQRAFVADASHQLRTPLTALRLRLENLEVGGSGDLESDLRAALAETDRLSRIVDGLLALARTEGTRPERVPVDVEAVLADRLEVWTPLAEERQVALRGAPEAAADGALTPQAGPLRALACEGYLEQMLDNFLANALEASPAGGRVTLFAVSGDDDVEVHVVDDGPGMTAADRENAFARFWRPEGATSDGTGLGLAIVAQLARVSGGMAWLAAAEGGGVDAVVRLDAA
jgi:signal transduction histidine kinase